MDGHATCRAGQPDLVGRARVITVENDEEEAWQVGRGDWALKTDHALDRHEVQIVNLARTVVAVATIRGVTRVRGGRRRFFLEGKRIKNDRESASPPRLRTRPAIPSRTSKTADAS